MALRLHLFFSMKKVGFFFFFAIATLFTPSIGFSADLICEFKLGTFNDPDLARTTRVLADHDFTSSRKRRLVTLLYHRPDAPKASRDEKSRDKFVKLLYVLIDTEKKAILWKFHAPFRDRPIRIILDEKNPNIAYIEKRVERLYLTSTAAPNIKPFRDIPELFFDTAFEILQVGNFGPNGETYTRDLLTSDQRINWDLESDHLKITGTDGKTTIIPLQQEAHP